MYIVSPMGSQILPFSSEMLPDTIIGTKTNLLASQELGYSILSNQADKSILLAFLFRWRGAVDASLSAGHVNPSESITSVTAE